MPDQALPDDAGNSNAPMTVEEFFRKLWSDPQLLDAYSAGGDERAAVLKGLNLTPEAEGLLWRGCMRDILQAIGGKKQPTPASSTTVAYNYSAGLTCDHPECQAYFNAIDNG